MCKFLSFINYCSFLSLVMVLCCFAARSQSTIFNIPSTDVIQEKSFFIEADFVGHITSYQKGGFQTYGYRTVYGIKKKFEVGFNLFYTRNGDKAPIEVQPNFKYKFYEKEKFGISASTGLLLSTPLNAAAGTRTSGMVYTNISKNLKHTNGTRLTGGIYTVVGAKKEFGTKTGVIVGIEQPLKGKLTFLGDWYSGENRFGYSTAGLNYALTKRQFLLVGYNFGNSGRGNNAISAFYGFTF